MKKSTIQKEELLHSYSNKYFKFDIKRADVRVETEDGVQELPGRLVLDRGDSVALLLWNTESNKLVLVNQFRYPTMPQDEGFITEVLAGVLESGEDPVEAVAREALEETGYAPPVENIQHISTFFVSPGGSSERIFLYFVEVTNAHKVDAGGGLSYEYENTNIVEYTYEQAMELLDKHEFYDAKTIIALMWLRNLKEE